MEQRWGARQDNSHNDDEVDGGGDEGDGDGSEDDDEGDDDDEGEDDGNGEDKGEDNKDNENEILGLSTWDLLGADFEREAAARGLS